VDELSRYLSVDISDWVHGAGYLGYQYSYRLDGSVIAWGGDSQRGTLLLSLSGGSLSAFGYWGVVAFLRDIRSKFPSVRIRFTRIDLAVDVPGSLWRHFDTAEHVYRRLLDGRIQRVDIVSNYRHVVDPTQRAQWVEDGHTCYIGSRESERMMRVYAKTLYDGTKVTRFELELKDRYAQVVGYLMLDSRVFSSIYLWAIDSMIRLSDLIDFSTARSLPTVSLPKRRQASRYRWLMMVAGAVIGFALSAPDLWFNVVQTGLARAEADGACGGRQRALLIDPPCGNTGVHFDTIPPDLAYLHDLALAYDTDTVIYGYF
jgi:DNA relaxase NicK